MDIVLNKARISCDITIEVLSLRQEIQTNLATNRNEMNNTRFTWKTLFSGKNHGNRIFHYEKTQNTIME